MVEESHQNVFLIQIDASSLVEFEISEFEISRVDNTCFSGPERQVADYHELSISQGRGVSDTNEQGRQTYSSNPATYVANSSLYTCK